jgi:hypothetical protein
LATWHAGRLDVSYLQSASSGLNGAAKLAATRKEAKYVNNNLKRNNKTKLHFYCRLCGLGITKTLITIKKYNIYFTVGLSYSLFSMIGMLLGIFHGPLLYLNGII